jgi:hypothetical protein
VYDVPECVDTSDVHSWAVIISCCPHLSSSSLVKSVIKLNKPHVLKNGSAPYYIPDSKSIDDFELVLRILHMSVVAG